MALPRRTLVHAGVTTAWTAPLVALAVPASAAACSGALVALSAQEVQGTRVEAFDDASGRLLVQVTVSLTNTGAAGSLVAAAVSGTNEELLSRLSIGTQSLGVVGSVVQEPGSRRSW
jgi:hypothetical protein